MSVTIYAEGGGDSASFTRLRKAFGIFFGKLMPDKDAPKVVASGSRGAAFKLFCKAFARGSVGEHCFLLVDSEGPVEPGTTAWQHLRGRPGDQWERPDGAFDDQALLMVQCMEAWFLADPNTIKAYFDHPRFRAAGLPKLVENSIEPISKAQIENGLRGATENTLKGEYHKTKHGPDLLERIRPDAVVAASGFAQQMETALRARLRTRRDLP